MAKLSRNPMNYTLSVAATGTTASTAIDAAAVIANCVPMHKSHRVTTVAGDQNDWSQYATRVRFTAGPPTVHIDRNGVTDAAIENKLSIIEFDPAEFKVQSGLVTLAAGAASTTPISLAGNEVANNRTLLVFNQMSALEGTGGADHNHVRGRLIDNSAPVNTYNEVHFERGTGTGSPQIDIAWWLVEAIGGTPAWEVEQLDFTIDTNDLDSEDPGNPTPGTIAMGPVDTAKTFIVPSYSTTVTSDNNDDLPYIRLLDANTVQAVRVSPDFPILITAFVVEFAAGGAEVVKRGLQSMTSGSGLQTDSVNINAAAPAGDVVQNLTTPNIVSPQSTRNGGWNGTNTASQINNQSTAEITSGANMDLVHFNQDATATGSVSWETIQWETGGGGAPTGRVLWR